MPAGKTHEKIALMSLFPTFLAGYFYFKDIGLASFLTLFTLFGAFLLSPDLDTRSSNYYRWGVFRLIWKPYRMLIKHRSSLSHSFIVGPVLKVSYLLVIFMIVFATTNYFLFNQDLIMLLGHQKNNLQNIFINFKIYVIIAFVGIIWANAQHLITDYVVSFCTKK